MGTIFRYCPLRTSKKVFLRKVRVSGANLPKGETRLAAKCLKVLGSDLGNSSGMEVIRTLMLKGVSYGCHFENRLSIGVIH